MSTRNLTLNVPFVNLKGQPVADHTLGVMLGEHIAGSTTPDALKFYGWAKDLSGGGDLTLGAADIAVLLKWVQDDQTMNTLFKGQLLEKLMVG